MSQFQVRYEHFKREDTTNSMVINLYDDNGAPITPSGSHTWTAKVATDDGYAGEFPVVLSGNDIVLRSSQMTRLPHGQYVLEIWENNNGAVTIYPNAGFIPFEIHKNAPDAIGIVEPTKDINKIIDDLHKAGQNIKLGTVTTGAPGSSVIIRQRLENGQNLLDFTIPRGADGATPQIGSNGNWVIAGHDTGKPSVGRQGDKGDPPTLRVGSVTKVAPGGNPTASVTGSNGDYSLNLGIPEGQQGTGFNRSGIASGTDLNSIKQSGYYSLMGATNIKNVPPVANTSYFNLVVFSDGDTLTQLVMDPNTAVMYMRGCTGGLTNWHSWAKIGGVSDQSGRNLLPGTSAKLISKSVTNNWIRFYEYTQQYLLDTLQGKGPFVARVWIDKPSVDSWLQFYSRSNGLFKGNTIKAGQSGYSTLTGEIKNDSDSINIVIGGGDNASVSLSYKELKLEYGDTPTAYSHAPEDLDNLINRVGGGN